MKVLELYSGVKWGKDVIEFGFDVTSIRLELFDYSIYPRGSFDLIFININKTNLDNSDDNVMDMEFGLDVITYYDKYNWIVVNTNPKVWDDFKINEDVRKELLTIGRDFFDKVELPITFVDIVLTGSLCNYNWSEKYSDFDLHIIINYEDIDENYELVEKFCDYAKKLWNSEHDIQISGFDVEVAIQDAKDLQKSIDGGKMGGVFSLVKNEWIKKHSIS